MLGLVLRICVIAFFAAAGLDLADNPDPIPLPLLPFMLLIFVIGIGQAFFLLWWNWDAKWTRPTWTANPFRGQLQFLHVACWSSIALGVPSLARGIPDNVDGLAAMALPWGAGLLTGMTLYLRRARS